jgi:hypothetical protein
MNFQNLFRSEPQARIQTALGELCVFAINLRDMAALLEGMRTGASGTETPAFIRNFARYVCFPPSSLRDGKYKPTAPVLDAEALSQLTNEDLETLATSYLEHNGHLYHARVEQRSTNDKGQPVISFKEGDITHQKKAEESNAEYLERLFGVAEDSLRKSNEEIAQTMQRAFSGGLLQEIQRTRSFGDEIRKSLDQTRESFKLPELPSLDVPYADLRSPPPLSVPRPLLSVPDVVSIQQAAFDSLGQKLDQLIDQFTKAAGFSIAAHEVQVGMASDLKTSSQENRRTGRANIALTIMVILITGVAVGTTLIQSHQDSITRAGDKKTVAEQVQTISAAIGNVRTQLEANGADAKLIGELRKRIDQLQEQINQQSLQMTELRKQRRPLKAGASSQK